MFTLLLGIAIGGFLVFIYMRKDTNVFPSKYDRMSSNALHDLYKEYETEMSFWVKVLTIDIQSIGLSDKAGHNWFSSQRVILKLKKLAVWRIDALEDIMEEIKASMHEKYEEKQRKIDIVDPGFSYPGRNERAV